MSYHANYRTNCVENAPPANDVESFIICASISLPSR